MTAIDRSNGTGRLGSGPGEAARHFDLVFLGALLRMRAGLPGLDSDEVRAAFPFLDGYLDQLPGWARPLEPVAAWRRWCDELATWEAGAVTHLPIAALRRAGGLDDDAIAMIITAGMADEDARFGGLVAALSGGGGGRPTAAFLVAGAGAREQREAARDGLARLRRRGILEPSTDDRGGDGPLRPAPILWTVLRGGPFPEGDGLEHHAAELARPMDELILAADLARRARGLPELLRNGMAGSMMVRGPAGSGRSTLVAAVARDLGLDRLDVDLGTVDRDHVPLIGSLAAALRAMPILRADPAIGETIEVPTLEGWDGPVGITLPRHGGARGPDLERTILIELAMPGPAERRRHWAAALAPIASGGVDGTHRAAADIDAIAERYRLAGGTIRRVARMARAAAALDGRTAISLRDVRDASRILRSRALETLAPRIDAIGSWDDLVVDAETMAELRLLEDRCRGREHLLHALPGPVGVRSAGVRAMFTGPSGTGKTLAARLLASQLEMDLHAVQLSSVVDKYIGETEKRITEVFTQAAELDAVTLLDEGDALMGKRTDVSSSTDRFANTQTNHLLQQLEDHDGIVVITTNAGERIDGAFLRRLDVVIEFRPPDAAQRWDLWRHHLPADHAVDAGALAMIAQRCALTGGQIRNAALHAWLLAMRRTPSRVVPTTADVDAGVRREYRKVGAVCPLRAAATGS